MRSRPHGRAGLRRARRHDRVRLDVGDVGVAADLGEGGRRQRRGVALQRTGVVAGDPSAARPSTRLRPLLRSLARRALHDDDVLAFDHAGLAGAGDRRGRLGERGGRGQRECDDRDPQRDLRVLSTGPP